MTQDLQANAVLDARSMRLGPLLLDPSDVAGGTPVASIGEVVDVAGVGVGVWELTPGVVTDTETDEVFVVLSGTAVVEFLDEPDKALRLDPGTIGRLSAGTRTRWTVTETLRKVYITLPGEAVGVVS
ncbi:cupin domain-containing protein [Glaciihabitans sp. dw_435]|uniref:cupin domain-containing protein n=1 Tax=Glaciihabitans sp. dw_435 TaxID=2720081 RepID=UPI002106982E|nr:cupin domain-containing protein [Glaciihabitans sp. dw_435]